MNEKINLDKKIKQILADSDLKITDNRCIILKVLLNKKSPVSYEQIKKYFSFDKATFYRNMILFEQKNIVNKFESKDRVWHYEISSNKHAHFICEKCDKIICFESNMPLQMEGHNINNMTISGTCKICIGK